MATLDDDAAAGQALFDQLQKGGSSDMPTITVTAPKQDAPPAPHDADASEGQKLFDAWQRQQQAKTQTLPPAQPPTPQQLLDAKLGVTGVRNALSYGPNEYHFGGLGALLPIAHDDATGKNSLAIPQVVRNLGNGVLDLVEGPTTGDVTQDARGALLTAALQGRNRMFGKSGSPLPASDFTANPVAGALDQSVLGKGGYKPSMTGTSMPIPDANMMSTATNKFVDAVYDLTARSIAGGAGATVGGLVGGPYGGAVGAFAAQAVHPQIETMLKTLLPPQRAAVAAAMTARGMGGLAYRLGLTAISPGSTPDSDAKPFSPPPQRNLLMPQNAPFA